MATVEVTLLAKEDIAALAKRHALPRDTPERIKSSLRTLEAFPRAGRALTGQWSGFRALVGPWGWLIAVYAYDEGRGKVIVATFQDARSADSAAASRA